MIDLHHLPGSSVSDETNVTVYRRHWLTLLPTVTSGVLLFLVPPGSYLALSFLKPVFLENSTFITLYIIGMSLFFLFGLLFIFQTFMEYWLDVFIVTDKRLIDIDQTGLFSRTVSELRMYRTQDVTAEVKGFLHSMFDYGDVFVQTAGEHERFHFKDVPNPNLVAKNIMDYAEADRKEHLEETVEEFGMTDQNTKREQAAKRLEP
jgi:uncharacterized membrane protein YdbT with pleckstrin-like domain